MKRLQLYTRQGCHLCEEMHEALERLAPQLGLQVEVIDVDASAAAQAYSDWVPVLVGNGEVICYGRLDESALWDSLGDE